jgi:2-oxoisovalerate dehydrogenase E1 component alpha subunit
MLSGSQEPLELENDLLRAMLRNMLLQRAVDGRAFALNRQGKISIAMGSEGHEAVQAGTGMAFARGCDILFPYYRNTGLILACGFSLGDLFRSQFARAGDRSKGRQIINHISANELGIASFSSIIASHCSHAAGAACALKSRGETGRVVFCQFGEGATSAGEWHESLNFAALRRLPVVFVCENNRWAISTHQSKQMANPEVAAKARGYGMPGAVVDGFDPVAVYHVVCEARERAARGDGPSLIEAKCYRFLSHTTDDDDRTYRTREEVAAERAGDPVPRFERRLLEAAIIAPDELETLRAEIAAGVDAITDEIEREPYPEPSDLYGNVYAGVEAPWV